MGLLMAIEAGNVDGLGRGCCGGSQGVVGGRGHSAWAEHGPVRDEGDDVRYQ